MKIFSLIIVIILIIFGLTFALLNATPVTLNYYIGTVHLSLSLLLVLTLGLGIIIGFFVALGSIFRAKGQNYQLRNRVRQYEREIDNLKKISSEGKPER